MLQNLHTHTAMCDGTDSPEETVIEAISLGFDSLGFSAHAKTPYETDWELKGVSDYISTITLLKDRYKGQIEIYLGAELDYYSADVMTTDILDYTIGSVHFALGKDGALIDFDRSADATRFNIENYFENNGIAYAEKYYEMMAEMPKRLKPDIIGHFDLLTKFSELDQTLFDTRTKAYKALALEALHEIRKSSDLFEINTGAMSRGYRTTPYPAPFILDEMRNLDCKIIITSDCHKKEFLRFGFDQAKEYVRAHGFNEIYNLTANGFVGEKI